MAAALGAAYLIIQPDSADHAAQFFRSELFADQGFSAWDNFWFGGHHLPGYGLLLPPLSSLIGARLVGVLSALAAALLFSAIAYDRFGERARLGVVWFATATSISLFTGRLTFALGVAVALAAVYAAQRNHRLVAIFFAALTPLASPVAALFLACGVIAYAIAERSRRGLELAVVTLGMALLINSAFPEGGTEPFTFSSYQPAILVAVAVFIALPSHERLLRYGVAAYCFALTAAFLIQTPMGGNATRLGSLLLGPVLAFGLWRRQRFALILLVPVLIYWQWSPVVRDLEQVSAQPSVNPGFYAPLIDFLRGQPRHDAYRVEVLPEAHHWESAYVPARHLHRARLGAPARPQAQSALLPVGPADGPEYRSWLDDLGVGYVAVPHAPLDYAARPEKRMLKRGPPRYLDRVYRSTDWTVYKVRNPSPLAIGGKMVKLRPQGFVVDTSAPGTVLVRVHWTPYWSIEQGTGCVEQAPGGYTMLDVETPGRFRVGIDFSPVRAISSGPRCHAGAGDPVRVGGERPARRGSARRRETLMVPAGQVADRVRRSVSTLLPRGPLDLLIQLALLAGAYWAWRHARGAVDGSMGLSFSHARDLVRPSARSGLLIEPSVQHWAVSAGWPAEVARWGYANLHFKGSCLMLAILYFGYRRQLRLRPQRGLRRDGHLGDRLRALPDRAAALPARARPRSLERGHRQQPAALEPGRPALQPVRGRALDARRPVGDPRLVAGHAGASSPPAGSPSSPIRC